MLDDVQICLGLYSMRNGPILHAYIYIILVRSAVLHQPSHPICLYICPLATYSTHFVVLTGFPNPQRHQHRLPRRLCPRLQRPRKLWTQHLDGRGLIDPRATTSTCGRPTAAPCSTAFPSAPRRFWRRGMRDVRRNNVNLIRATFQPQN